MKESTGNHSNSQIGSPRRFFSRLLDENRHASYYAEAHWFHLSNEGQIMRGSNHTTNLLVLFWLAFASVGVGDDSFQFHKLEVPYKATTIATTPDLKLLLIAHEEDDKVTVWNTSDLQKSAEFDCPEPRFILTRGEKIYIASYESGMINVFNRRWEQINQVESGLKRLTHLSAPRGAYFEERLVATGNYPAKSSNGIMYVDIAGDTNEFLLRESSVQAVAVSHDGRRLVLCERTSSDSLKALDLKSNIGEMSKHRVYGHSGDSSIFSQWRDSQYWVGDRSIVTGDRPEPILEKDSRHLIVADENLPVFYELYDGEITARALNNDLTEIGRKKFKAPPECDRLDVERRTSLKQFRDAIIYEHVAFTDGMHTHLVVFDGESKQIYYARAEPFNVPAHVVNAAKVPKYLVEGERFRFQLFGERAQGEYDVISGPTGFEVTSDGELTWMPAGTDVGDHEIKLRAVVDGNTTFPRLSLTVVSDELAKALDGDLTKLKDAGRFSFEETVTTVRTSLDMNSVFVLAGDEFVLLDAGGFTALRREKLAKTYKRLAEREAYYVALSDNSLDLLDKKSLN